jgi:hypothetical protein
LGQRQLSGHHCASQNDNRKYPPEQVGRDRPYSGIENLRPESKAMVDAFMSWQARK